MEIIKREGNHEQFNWHKIEKGCYKAAERVESQETAEVLARLVARNTAEHFSGRKAVKAGELRTYVLKELNWADPKVAASFRSYRR